jgi:L-fuculose-phosphate aldolase
MREYASRPEVQCVLHAHPCASTLMATLGIEIEPLDLDYAALTNQMPVLDDGAISISPPARGDAVAGALSTIGAVLLKNHGVVVAGAGMAEVCVTALKIEKWPKLCFAVPRSPSCR